jgi:ABC-type sulfate transport system permease component
MEIKKIKKLSLANIVALFYALFGFVVPLAALVHALVKVIYEKETAGKLTSYIFINLGVDFLISLAVAVGAGIIGWLIGFIMAGFYNFLAREIGGVKIELADEAGQKIIKTEEKKQEFFKY